MRLARMLGLAVIAAVAAMAFVGAGTATADEIAICPEDVELCTTGFLKEGSVIKGVAGPSTLLGTIDQECESSTAEFKIEGTNNSEGMGTEENGLELKPVGAGLSFQGCEPCEKVITSIGTAKLTMTGTDYNLKGTGKAELVNCIFGIDCTFEGTADLLVTQGKEGSIIHAEKEVLTRTGGSAFFCGNTGEWDALYTTKGHWGALVKALR